MKSQNKAKSPKAASSPPLAPPAPVDKANCAPANAVQQDKKPATVAHAAKALSADEQERLKTLEGEISEAVSQQAESDKATIRVADALHEIRNTKLYRAQHASLAGYAKAKFGYERAHANRLAEMGALRVAYPEVSPRGDIVHRIQQEGAARPLVGLGKDLCLRDAVLDTLARWIEFQPEKKVTAKLVKTAITVAKADAANARKKANTKRELVIQAILEAENSETDSKHREAISLALQSVREVVEKIFGAKRTTGIAWTENTWNPLVGCSPASAGCVNCYSAALCGKRLKNEYGHLVKEKGGGKFAFTGDILFLPERLAEPLENSTPSKYFVNSMSDLFHQNVPDAFAKEVFAVMEKAHWHKFQVLTKRPDRMAKFTAEYFKGRKPPAHIWLGTSTENQQTYDDRLPHLQKTVAAVRWISAEPLIGPIEMGALEGVGWVVVGGESGSTRKMEKVWATDIRDACKKSKVPFFFKQWGVYGEDGAKLTAEQKAAAKKALPTIDGKTYAEFPSCKAAKGKTAGDKTPAEPQQEEPVRKAA